MRNFKEYHVWKNSHELVLKIYEMVGNLPSEEKFALKQQMCRAAYSIPSNFAEGCGRGSDKDFNRFLQICLGSAHELEYFVFLSKELKYIETSTADDLDQRINSVKKQLYALSQKLKL